MARKTWTVVVLDAKDGEGVWEVVDEKTANSLAKYLANTIYSDIHIYPKGYYEESLFEGILSENK